MFLKRDPVSILAHLMITVVLAGASQAGRAAQTSGSSGAQQMAPGGAISAPPMTSAMRSTGGSAAARQTSTSQGESASTATATNAMTLTSHGQDQQTQGGQDEDGRSVGTSELSAPGRDSGSQAPSIDSNGIIQRNGPSPPR